MHVWHNPFSDSAQLVVVEHLLSLPNSNPIMHLLHTSSADSQYFKSLSSLFDLHFPSDKSIA